jgi:hypothetical protein
MWNFFLVLSPVDRRQFSSETHRQTQAKEKFEKSFTRFFLSLALFRRYELVFDRYDLHGGEFFSKNLSRMGKKSFK